MRTLILMIALSLFIAGCGNPDREKLDYGVGYAKRTIESVNRNPMAAMSLYSIADQGGSLVDYLAANAPESAASRLPHLENNTPTQPWTVVLSWSSPTNVLIQGYGTDLAKPLVTETVCLTPFKKK